MRHDRRNGPQGGLQPVNPLTTNHTLMSVRVPVIQELHALDATKISGAPHQTIRSPDTSLNSTLTQWQAAHEFNHNRCQCAHTVLQ